MISISARRRRASLATPVCSPLPAPRCCHAHDCCYQKLFDQGCHPYVDHYEHTIENNATIVCSECPAAAIQPQEKGVERQPCQPVLGAVRRVAR